MIPSPTDVLGSLLWPSALLEDRRHDPFQPWILFLALTPSFRQDISFFLQRESRILLSNMYEGMFPLLGDVPPSSDGFGVLATPTDGIDLKASASVA